MIEPRAEFLARFEANRGPRTYTTAEFVEAFRQQIIHIESGCWQWTGRVDKDGYGRVRYNDRPAALAHRVAYELFIADIPTGLTIDHLCRNRSCVNPEHLEAVTQVENMRRMRSSHCAQGHEFTDENVRLDSRGKRSCRACARARSKRYAASRRSRAVA